MTPPEIYRSRILEVQRYIQRHLDGDLSLETLAHVAHFSPYHFHRIFSGLVGESVADYVRRLRLELAAHRLRYRDDTILAAAVECGYASHEAFTRAFQRMFGVSPSEYRSLREPPASRKAERIMAVSFQTSDVRLEQLPARRIACLRHVGPYQDVGPTFQRFAAWAGPRRLFGPQTLAIAVYYDDPEVTAPEKLRADCGITVGDQVTAEGEVQIVQLPGGEYAVLTHKGPYSELGNTYRWLYAEWLPASGREPGDTPPYEIYRNDCNTVAPEELLTDICIPLR